MQVVTGLEHKILSQNSTNLLALFAGVHIALEVVQEPEDVPAAALVADLCVGGRRGEEDDEVIGVGNLREAGSREEIATYVLSLIMIKLVKIMKAKILCSSRFSFFITHLHCASVEEYVQPARDAAVQLTPLRNVGVTAGLHARIIRRHAVHELLLELHKYCHQISYLQQFKREKLD